MKSIKHQVEKMIKKSFGRNSIPSFFNCFSAFLLIVCLTALMVLLLFFPMMF